MNSIMKTLLLLLCLTGAKLMEETQSNLMILATLDSPVITEDCGVFLRSCRVYGVNCKVVHTPGINMTQSKRRILVKEALINYKDQKDTIILVTDCEQSLLLAGEKELISRFEGFSSKVLLSAGSKCKKKYAFPDVEKGYPCINFGAIMGYAEDLYSVLEKAIAAPNITALYSSFIQPNFINKYQIALDSNATLIDNLISAGYLKLEVSKSASTGIAPINPYPIFIPQMDVTIRIAENFVDIYNHEFQTTPVVMRGYGLDFMRIASYLAKSWTLSDGCLICKEDNLPLPNIKVSDWPVVLIGVFVNDMTPFFPGFLEKLYNLDYPVNKLHIRISCMNENHRKDSINFVSQFQGYYLSISSVEAATEAEARAAIMNECLDLGCDFYLSLDGTAHLDEASALQQLITLNRSIVAPMLLSSNAADANFYNYIESDGSLGRIIDWTDIVKGDFKSLLMMPFISSCYLVKSSLIRSYGGGNLFNHPDSLSPDLAFAINLREKGVVLYLYSEITLGHLINTAEFKSTETYPELYEAAANQQDWEQTYLHPQYLATSPHSNNTACPDVHLLPVFNEKFCKELLEKLQTESGWQDLQNTEITSVNLRKYLHYIVSTYVGPVHKTVWPTFEANKLNEMWFSSYLPEVTPVTRESEQYPGYYIQLSLNSGFQGGEMLFPQYNCSIDTSEHAGWVLIFPSMLTHAHEQSMSTGTERYTLTVTVYNDTITSKIVEKVITKL